MAKNRYDAAIASRTRNAAQQREIAAAEATLRQMDTPFLPIGASFRLIWLAFGFAVGIGLSFDVYPAREAAMLDPIAALRHE